MIKIRSSEITPEHIYLSRRKFMVGIGALAASSALLAACGTQEGAVVKEGEASAAGAKSAPPPTSWAIP